MGRESEMTEGCVSFASHTLHREEGSGHATTVCVRRLTISLLKPLQVSVVDLGIGDGMFTCRQGQVLHSLLLTIGTYHAVQMFLFRQQFLCWVSIALYVDLDTKLTQRAH